MTYVLIPHATRPMLVQLDRSTPRIPDVMWAIRLTLYNGGQKSRGHVLLWGQTMKRVHSRIGGTDIMTFLTRDDFGIVQEIVPSIQRLSLGIRPLSNGSGLRVTEADHTMLYMMPRA